MYILSLRWKENRARLPIGLFFCYTIFG